MGAAWLISGATMLSRVLGLVREQMFAALMGASTIADAYIVAFRVPNLLRDLLAEGALSQAFVPTFKATLKQHGRERAYLLGNEVAGNILVVTGVIMLLLGVFTPQVIGLLAGKFQEIPRKFELTVELTRIMLPFLATVSMAAVAMGMLNAQERYTTPALAPAIFNVASIVVGFVLHFSGAGGRTVVIGWAVGTVIAGLAQLGLQLPPLWRTGWRPRLAIDLRLRDPAVRRIALIMAPAIVAVAAVQLNVFVNTWFAASERGAQAWLNYAFRFLQLPIGVFGFAIATVSTTRYAEAAADGDRAALGHHLVDGLRLVAFLCVPATVGLLLLGEPIVRLLYERGRFFSWDTAATTGALDYYVIGLVAYAAVKVLAPAFFATNLTRYAVIASLVSVAGNLVSNLVLHEHHGFRILALGTSIAAILNCGVLYVMFHRRITAIPHGALLGHLARIGAAAAVMAAAVWGIREGLDHVLGHRSTPIRLLEVGVPVVVGAVVYAFACATLGVEEFHRLARKIAAKLGKAS